MKKNLILSFVTGILLTLPFVSNFSGFILFLGFLPLFIIEKHYFERKNEYKPIVFFNFAYLAFAFWNLFSLWWTINSAWFSILPPVLLNSFFMALVFLIFHIAHRNLSEKFAFSTLVFFWLAFEYIHFNWFLAFPWLNLGNGLANDLQTIQWYEYTGILGGSFWILLVNILIFRMFRLYLKYKTPKAFLLEIVFLIALITLPIYFSKNIIKKYKAKQSFIQVAIIQPNIDSYTEKYNPQLQIANFNKILNQINSISNKKVDFIILPETSISRNLEIIWQNDFKKSKTLSKIKDILKQMPQTHIVLGANTFKVSPQKQQTATIRYDKSLNVYYEAFSSALQIHSGNQTQVYNKSQFVLGVEKMPFANIFPWLDNLMVDFGGIVGSLASDNERKTFTNNQNKAKIGVPICYETLFGEFITDFVKNDANVLFIITNDGWWGDTPGYRQHAKLSQLRAIENRRSIARAANTGISAIINPLGEIEKDIKYNKQGTLEGKISLNSEKTFYAKNGDLIGRIALFFAGLFLIYLFVQLKTKKPN